MWRSTTQEACSAWLWFKGSSFGILSLWRETVMADTHMGWLTGSAQAPASPTPEGHIPGTCLNYVREIRGTIAQVPE